jgi:hypothetical protein
VPELVGGRAAGSRRPGPSPATSLRAEPRRGGDGRRGQAPRGGTVLQPGVDLLERADDFPATAPILVITDGACDVLRVRREHAYLVPEGARLPFTPRGPVFRVR